MKDPKISELTVSQLRRLIKATVQEAVAEVLIEINAIAEAEEKLQSEAEMAEFLKTSMQGIPYHDVFNTPRVDD